MTLLHTEQVNSSRQSWLRYFSLQQACWLRLAARNLLRNSRRTLLLILTLVTSALALLLFIGYFAAVLTAIKESTIRSGLGHLQLARGQFGEYEEFPMEHGLTVSEQQQIEQLLSSSPSVLRVVPRLQFQGLVSNGPKTLTFQGLGIDPVRERNAFSRNQHINVGEPLRRGDEQQYKVVLGREMARQLGVKPGDSVTLMGPTVYGSTNAIDVTVTGILQSSVPAVELYTLQLPIAVAQEFLRTEKISYYTTLLEDTELTDKTQVALIRQLPAGLEVRSWHQIDTMHNALRSMYFQQFVVLGCIMAVVILLSVATMTLTTIYERAREIGTLRSFGIPALTVRRVFIYEGLMQGLLGAILGLMLAYVLILLVNHAGIMLPPPPGQSSRVTLRLMWNAEWMLPFLAVLPLLAMTASWLVTRRLVKMPILKALQVN